MHFSIDEWRSFKRKTIEPEIYNEMEVHLQFCQGCQEFYLDLIQQSDIDLAKAVIPQDFTDSLLNRLGMHLTPIPIIIKLPVKKPSLNRKNIFAYYVTAAVLTLALMCGGIFDRMVDQSMRISQVCMLQSQNIETKVSKDWSSQLFEDSSQWMQRHTNEKERNVKDAK